MAWKYVRASDVEGQRQRQATLDRMTVWWTAFVHKLPEFGAEREAQPDGQGVFPRVVAVSESLRTWMDEQIGLVDPRLRWELTEDDAGEHLLAITCGEHLHLRPVVQSLVLRAPPIPRWKFQTPKPRCPPPPRWMSSCATNRVSAARAHGHGPVEQRQPRGSAFQADARPY